MLFILGCRPKVYSVDVIPWEIYKKYETKKKLHCLRKVKKIAIKKMKGVKNHLVRQDFTHNNYLKAILTGKPFYVEYFSINSRRHVVSTYKKGKLGLSGRLLFIQCYGNSRVQFFKKSIFFIFLAFYDKRLIEKCKVHTTPLGFFKTKEPNYTCYKCQIFGKYYNTCKNKMKKVQLNILQSQE